MRVKFGRPDLADDADWFDVPASAPQAPLTVTWLGVTTLLIDDGESALMTDGFFTRPSLPKVRLRSIAPSQPRIQDCLSRAGVCHLEAVIALHTHYDHAMDCAVVADRTGAPIAGC
jgi:L-ascorbate metabolism protein UlaG (beta-lactamase superfamily)